MTTKDKLIENQKELIWRIKATYGLDCSLFPPLMELETEIASLESEIAKEQIMLCNWDHLPKDKYKDHGWHLPDGNELATAHSKEQEPEGVTADYMQTRDLTDEEWMALPKEEILQLYKNCYGMLLQYARTKQINLRDEITLFTDFLSDECDIAIHNKVVKKYLQSKEK